MPQKSLARQFDKRLQLFLSNQAHSQLRDHALTGSMQGKRAFSVTGDHRVVYRQISETEVEFLDVGTHAQVYS